MTGHREDLSRVIGRSAIFFSFVRLQMRLTDAQRHAQSRTQSLSLHENMPSSYHFILLRELVAAGEG